MKQKDGSKESLGKDTDALDPDTGPCHYPRNILSMYHCLYIDSIFTWIVTRPCDPDEHFDVIALMLEPLASCCVSLCVWGGGVGHVALKIML
jgi:hypothetical protein